jgi:hypothetical protein
MLTRRVKRGGRKTRRGGESDRAAIIKILQPITEKTSVVPSGLGSDAAFQPKDLRQDAHTNLAIKANNDKTLTKFGDVPDPEVKEMNAITTPAPLPPAAQEVVTQANAITTPTPLPPATQQAVTEINTALGPSPAPKKSKMTEAELNAAAEKLASRRFQNYESKKRGKDAKAAAESAAAVAAIKKGGRTRKNNARKSTFRRHRK